VIIPLLLVTAWFSHHQYAKARPVYYSNAVISVAPPSTRVDQVAPGAEVRRNGLLDVGGATLITNMAAMGLRDPAVVSRVVAAGGKWYYTTRMFPIVGNQQQLPLIMIEATTPVAEDSTRTVELVAAQADSTLRTLQQQAGVPDDQMVKPFIVSRPTEPAGGMPSRTKATVATFGAGIGLSVLLTVLADVLLSRRRNRIDARRREEAARIDESEPQTRKHSGEQADPKLAGEVNVDSV
jgi:hypothetical protein